MTKQNISKTKWIWLSVLTLLVCVTATTVAFCNRLDSFLLDDEGAISLVTEKASDTDGSVYEDEDSQGFGDTHAQSSATEQGSAVGSDVTENPAESSDTTAPLNTQPSENPGFETVDDNTVWSTNTQVEIFKVSYVNGEQIVTVNGDNGDKIIAPGTENSYTFKLKNTGDVALGYTVEVDAYITPADVEIPINGRLNRYDGKWLVGGKDEYVNVSLLDTAEDHGTLGAGKYTYYTLDWMWPFESGNDELDTMLGNLATEQDLTFTIVIKTTATESSDPDDDSGITSPQTGDNTNLAVWIVIAASSFTMMILLLIFQSREKRLCYGEANEN